MDQWSSPSVVHDNRLLTFQVDTSPSIYSKPREPIVRINPSPPPGQSSSRMHFHADDPAFSEDPRLNPHHVSQETGPPPYFAIPDTTAIDPHPRSHSSPPIVTPPVISKDPSLQPKRQQSAPEASTSDDLKQRTHSRSSLNFSLDSIDELDESDPFGRCFHHGGPYHTANAALKPQRHSPPRMATSPESGNGSQHMWRRPPIPTGQSLNLVPGQIMPRMPYQPPPPSDYTSPEPRFGSPNLYPDTYPSDAPPFPQQTSPESMRMPDIRFSAPPLNSNWNPAFPIPQHSGWHPQYPNTHHENMIPPHSIRQQSMPQYSNPYLPPSKLQRHSLSTRARPPPFSPIHDPYDPNIRHGAPSNPIRSLSRKSVVPPPLPDISLPPQAVHAQPATKPAPIHVPKRLVMPTPLQQQQQQEQHSMNGGNYLPQALGDIHARDDYFFGNRDGMNRNSSYVDEFGNGRVQPQAMPQPHAPPMVRDNRNSRHLLKRRSTIGGLMEPPPVDVIQHFASVSITVPNEKQGKVKEKSFRLFRSGTKAKVSEKEKPKEKEKEKEKEIVVPRLGRKLSKRHF